MNKEVEIIKKFLEKNEYKIAEEHSLGLIKKFPNHYIPYLMYGICCLSLFKYLEAKHSFLKGIEINSNDFALNNNLAVVLNHLEEYHEVDYYLSKAKSIAPEDPYPLIQEGLLFMKKRDFLRAQHSFDKAIMLFNQKKIPFDTAPLNTYYSESLIANLDYEKLEEFYRETQKKEFDPELFYLMSGNNRSDLDGNALKEVEDKYLKKNFINLYQKTFYGSGVYFGLARLLEKKDKIKSEFYYHKGNSIIKNFQRFNLFTIQKTMKKSMDVFLELKKNISKLSHIENKSSGLIFITGMPRSGTTLVESIVASNEDVFSGGEMKTLYDRLTSYVTNYDFSDMDYKGLEEITNEYYKKASYLKKDKIFFIDKLPENFIFIGIINLIFPKAKIIHISRDPWDNAISLYKQRYIRNVHYSSEFFSIAVQLANHQKMLEFWQKNISQDQIKKIYFTQYEEVVQNQSTFQKSILEFCQIDIQKSLDREKFFSNTASMNQVRSNISAKSLKKDDFIDYQGQFISDFQDQLSYWKNKI